MLSTAHRATSKTHRWETTRDAHDALLLATLAHPAAPVPVSPADPDSTSNKMSADRRAKSMDTMPTPQLEGVKTATLPARPATDRHQATALYATTIST